MSDELLYLTYTILLTAVMWVPYILNTIASRGLVQAVGYADNPPAIADWAQRLKAAHYNAVENMVLFAPLVILVEIQGANSANTALACMIFLLARVVHALSYTFKIPWVRTLAFAVGIVCVLDLILVLLGS